MCKSQTSFTEIIFSSNRFPESRDNWGTLYPPEDKDPPEFGEEPYREEQASYPTYTQYWFAKDAMEIRISFHFETHIMCLFYHDWESGNDPHAAEFPVILKQAHDRLLLCPPSGDDAFDG